MLVSLGVAFYTEAQLATGSTAGLALLLQYATGIPFGWLSSSASICPFMPSHFCAWVGSSHSRPWPAWRSCPTFQARYRSGSASTASTRSSPR
nr:hypothetical protein [Devosia aurantiaca]